MIKMIPHTLSISNSENELNELNTFLSANIEINEAGNNGLLQFFQSRPNLLMLMGNMLFSIESGHYQSEFNVFNEFRADFAICNSKRNNFIFIEFEDAKSDSVFKPIENRCTTRYEWSTRFEHGFSQLIDWYYRIDDFGKTNKLLEHFGSKQINYTGLLVVGRDKFINNAGLSDRLIWRKENTLINGRHVHCLTFDQLYVELYEKLETIKLLVANNL